MPAGIGIWVSPNFPNGQQSGHNDLYLMKRIKNVKYIFKAFFIMEVGTKIV
jgi:hypothetical protein